MSADNEKSVGERVHISGEFALHLDGTMDISGHAHLLANVCFVDGDHDASQHCGPVEFFFFCLSPPGWFMGNGVCPGCRAFIWGNRLIAGCSSPPLKVY